MQMSYQFNLSLVKELRYICLCMYVYVYVYSYVCICMYSPPFICSNLTNQSIRFVSNNCFHLNGLFLTDTSPDGNKKINVLTEVNNYYRFMSGNVIWEFPDQLVLNQCLAA